MTKTAVQHAVENYVDAVRRSVRAQRNLDIAQKEHDEARGVVGYAEFALWKAIRDEEESKAGDG